MKVKSPSSKDRLEEYGTRERIGHERKKMKRESVESNGVKKMKSSKWKLWDG